MFKSDSLSCWFPVDTVNDTSSKLSIAQPYPLTFTRRGCSEVGPQQPHLFQAGFLPQLSESPADTKAWHELTHAWRAGCVQALWCLFVQQWCAGREAHMAHWWRGVLDVAWDLLRQRPSLSLFSSSLTSSIDVLSTLSIVSFSNRLSSVNLEQLLEPTPIKLRHLLFYS